MSGALIEIARIKGPNGLNGKMLIAPSGKIPEGLCNFKHIIIGRQGVSRNVVSCRKKKKGQLVLEVEGINSVGQVELLAGESLYIMREWLPEPPCYDRYSFELVGFMVMDVSGRCLGRILDVFYNGGNDVFVVNEEKEYLIPATTDMIMDLSVEDGTVTIDASLLDDLID